MSTRKSVRTTTEAELREMIEGRRMTIRAAAAELGRPENCVRLSCSLLGIRSTYRKGVASEGRAKNYFADFAAGMSIAEVAAAHGVTRQAVSDALHKANLPASNRALAKWLIAQSRSTPLPLPSGVEA